MLAVCPRSSFMIDVSNFATRESGCDERDIGFGKCYNSESVDVKSLTSL